MSDLHPARHRRLVVYVCAMAWGGQGSGITKRYIYRAWRIAHACRASVSFEKSGYRSLLSGAAMRLRPGRTVIPPLELYRNPAAAERHSDDISSKRKHYCTMHRQPIFWPKQPEQRPTLKPALDNRRDLLLSLWGRHRVLRWDNKCFNERAPASSVGQAARAKSSG